MNPIRRTRPERTGVRAPLGDLEMSVMRYIWAGGATGCQGADVQTELSKDRPVALTTVLTTLDRLFAKGILSRTREGKAYRYRAALSEEQLQQRIVQGVLGNLIAQFPAAVASYLAEQGICTESANVEKLKDLAQRIASIQAPPSDRLDTPGDAPENAPGSEPEADSGPENVS